MTTHTEILSIKLTTDGEGRVKAAFVEVAKGSEQAAAGVDKLNKELAENKTAAAGAAQQTDKLADEQKELAASARSAAAAQQQANAATAGSAAAAKNTAGAFGTLRQAIGAIGLSTVIQHSIQTIVEFQRLEAVLRTLEGSQGAANAKMRELQDIATKTPSQLQEVVQAYSTLKARGLDPGREALLAYSNIAAATGKTLQDVVEAVGDAATGENERLKSLGVIARQVGNDVQFTFQGVTTTVQKNAGAIEDYLQRIGSVNFAGASAAQMETLGGAASNLMGAVDRLIVSVGDSGLTGSLTRLAGGVATVAGGFADFFDMIENGDGKLGLFKNSVVDLVRFLDRANTLVQGIQLPGLVDPREAFGPRGPAADTGAVQSQASAVDLLKASYDALSAAVGGVYADSQKKAKAETDKTLGSLRDQAATVGLSRVALLEYQKAQALASAGTEAQRKEIGALYDTIIRKTRAEEASTKATKDDTKAKAEAKREAEELRRITEQQVRAAMQLVEAYDLTTKHAREFAEAERDTAAAVKEGAITAEQRAKVLADLRFDQIIEQVRELGEEFKALPSKLPISDIEWREVGMRGASSFADAFTDGLLSGDWEAIGKRWLESLFGDSMRTLIEQQFVRPMQQAIGNGSGPFAAIGQILSGRANESAPDFVGPPSTLAGQGGFWSQNGQRIMGGASGAFGVYQGYRQGGIGGAATGAMGGFQLGNAIAPGIGGIVGAIIGGLAGLLGGEGKPRLRVGASQNDGVAVGAFGRIGVARDNMEPGTATRVAQGIAQFDNNLASLLRTVDSSGGALDRARTAASRFTADVSGSNATLEEILSRRFDAIVAAVEPGWARFLGQIDDLETRVSSFQALYTIRDQIDALSESAATLGGSPLEQLRAQLTNLGDKVTETAAALAAAIEAQDPVAIRDAGVAAQEAVLARFNAEIQLARDLEAAILDAQAAARATQLTLAQRIQATGGPAGLVAGVAASNMATLRGQVTGTADPTRALAFLSEFTSSVDAWLQASIADVQQLANAEQQRVQQALAGIAAQRDALQAALAALTAERDSIIAEATARTQAENAAWQAQAQAVQAAQEELRRGELERLQQQLGIAEEFKRVLDDAERMVKELTFSSSNPLGGFARLDLLGNAIAQAEQRVAGSTGSDRAAAASELLDLLQQRLGMVQQEGLFQRPSGQYLDVYNDTLRRIASVQGVAQTEADRALDLQQRIADLSQQTTDAIVSIATGGVRFTADEQARIDAIAAEEAERQEALARLAEEEAALQQELVEIQRRLDTEITALNATAREQYEWARGEAQRLEAERIAGLQAQLDELTGGRPVDQFIAERTAEAASLLTEIRDDLRAFLEAISSGSVGGGATPGVGVAPGGGGLNPIDNRIGGKDSEGDLSKPGVFAPVININGATGDAQQIARAVRDTINNELPQFATRLKRELQYG